MCSGYVDTVGMIQECQLIAEIKTIERNKAEPFLTLPFCNFYLNKIF